MKAFGVTRDTPPVKVMSLLTSKPASDMALAAPRRMGDATVAGAARPSARASPEPSRSQTTRA
jgi:hypothetical protein